MLVLVIALVVSLAQSVVGLVVCLGQSVVALVVSLGQSVVGLVVWPVSGRTSGLSRPVSGRTSGLRGKLRGHSVDQNTFGDHHETVEEGTRSQPRPASGRLTGLRGTLVRQSQESPVAQFSSEPNLHSPTPRPGTAVLARGHRPLRVGPLDTDVVALPVINSGERGGGAGGDEVGFEPPLSTEEPQDSTHLTHPSDLEECLASISHFDHTHLGQIGRNSQGSHSVLYLPLYVPLTLLLPPIFLSLSTDEDVLEMFLAEYRQKKADTDRTSEQSTTCPHSQLHSEGERVTAIDLPRQQPTSEEGGLGERGEGEVGERGEGEVGEGMGFCIPVLPEGRQLVLSILSTWGDQYYVGLTGIEVFTASGERASVREV